LAGESQDGSEALLLGAVLPVVDGLLARCRAFSR